MFAYCLHPSAQFLPSNDSSSQLRLGTTAHDRLIDDAPNDVDVALKNLVGNGATDAAQRWADHGKLLQKFAIVRDYLGKGEHNVMDKLLGTDRSAGPVSGEPFSDPPERTLGDRGKGKETNAARYYARESEEDTDFGDSDDERGKTAHKLFASLAGIDEGDKENMWWFSLPSSQVAEQDVDISQALLDAGSQGRGEPVGNGAWRLNRLTPAVSSPIRPPINKSGLKPCDVTPRQSQLSASVRKKVAAKNPASPATPRTPNPSRSIMRSTGATIGTGHSLASPICLLSSPPAVPAKGRRQIPERTKLSAGPSPVTRTTLPKPHVPNLTTKTSKAIPAIPEATDKTCDHQIENIASSSALRSTNVKLSAKRKHLTDECPPLAPDSSKKRRRAANTIDPSSGVSPKTNRETRIPSEKGFIPTEREKLALKRMDIAQQLANAYPHLVAPSLRWGMYQLASFLMADRVIQ